jgi:hypothetical protein
MVQTASELVSIHTWGNTVLLLFSLYLFCCLFHFSFLILVQSVGLLGRRINPSQGRYLHAEQHKHRINAHHHSCLKWDSNTQSQRSCLRPRDHCDRHLNFIGGKILIAHHIGRDHLGVLGIDGRIILSCVLKKCVRRLQTKFIKPSS